MVYEMPHGASVLLKFNIDAQRVLEIHIEKWDGDRVYIRTETVETVERRTPSLVMYYPNDKAKVEF